ncbi:unnamed protein product [Acanthocheilonema viteae]|uniref:Uncharacterized protein n=1 Tax=Acanthocheilonema viteae TaxID=6277 RepID=A0A498SYF6_ACAVI|nr:unnamed protein product [Acanthocheilonema viteae]
MFYAKRFTLMTRRITRSTTTPRTTTTRSRIFLQQQQQRQQQRQRQKQRERNIGQSSRPLWIITRPTISNH